MKKMLFITALLVIITPMLFAELIIGSSAGISVNIPQRKVPSWASDMKYNARIGFSGGVMAEYGIKDWLAVRTDVNFLFKNYQLSRSKASASSTRRLESNYRDLYIEVPFMADFRYSIKKFTGHAYVGAYVGAWLNKYAEGYDNNGHSQFVSYNGDKKFTSDDKRFNVGAIGGLGLTYKLDDEWSLLFDSMFYKDLNSYYKGSSIMKENRYNSTMAFQLGMTYTLKGGASK